MAMIHECSLRKSWVVQAGLWIFRNVITVPNIITVIGIFLTWKMAIWRLDGQADLLTFCFLVGAVLTDKLDGIFAKLWKQSTALGSILDKFRDKFLILSTFFFIFQSFRLILTKTAFFICLSLTLTAVVELVLLFIGGIVSLAGAKLRANEFGRWKMGYECTAVIIWSLVHDLHLFNFHLTDNFPGALILASLIVSFFLAVASAHGQIRSNWPLIKKVASIIRINY